MPGTEPITPTDPHAQLERLQAEIDRLRGQLTDSHRLSMLGIAAGMIAHEFNNILTPVLGYAKAALARPDDAALVRKALQQSASAVERASSIAEAVLSIAKGGGAAPEDCEIEACISAAVQSLGRDLRQDGIALSIEASEGMRAAISATALEQVLLNLLLNAREAMTPGGGQLAIRVGGCSTWNTHATIEVSDTGKGIPLQLRDRVFEPFVSGRGTGLGLAVCRALVEAVGGSIRAEPRQGGGTTVIVELPSAQAPKRQRAQPEPSREKAA